MQAHSTHVKNYWRNERRKQYFVEFDMKAHMQLNLIYR